MSNNAFSAIQSDFRDAHSSMIKLSMIDVNAKPPSLHSRDSSGASDCLPVTPVFATSAHSRIASTSSTISSAPSIGEIEAQYIAPSKTILDDLVEQPEEVEDVCYDMCDDIPDCVFTNRDSLPSKQTSNPIPARKSADDDGQNNAKNDFEPLTPSKSRRASEEPSSPGANIATRFGGRLPSLSRRLKDMSNTAALRNTPPPSRTSSSRVPSLTSVLARQLEEHNMNSPPDSRRHSWDEDEELEVNYARNSLSESGKLDSSPFDIKRPMAEEADENELLSSTPLLPPSMLLLERRDSETQLVQSPLQSPTVADPSFGTLPSPCPRALSSVYAAPTPPLSTRPSFSSAMPQRSSLATNNPGVLVPSAEIPSLDIEPIDDEWSAKLGHANFAITPEPYLPDACDKDTCLKLTLDWECARKKYMRHANHTSEHYGPTSQTYKLTEQKWAPIDALWKEYHDKALAKASAADYDTSDILPLAESSAMTPSFSALDDGENAIKFPMYDDGTIVGPMVQYAPKIQPRHSRRASVIKYFNDLCRPAQK